MEKRKHEASSDALIIRRPVSIEELTSVEQLQAMETPWRELWRRDPSATPFQSPDWVLPWQRHFGSGDVFAVISRDGERLTGLMPTLILRDDDDPSESLGMLLGSGNTDYLDALLDGADASEMLARLTTTDCAMWDLQQLRESSPLLEATVGGCDDVVEPQDACLVMSIENAGDELQNITSTHFRKKLRYYRKSLARDGELTFATPSTETLDSFMDALYELHAARWNVRGLPGMLADQVDQAFHREVARCMLQSGALRMYAMRVGERIVAVFYGLAHHSTVYFYLSGYDPALEKMSPGTVIVAHAIEEAVRSGATSFDFLRGAEDYKYAWGAKDRWNKRRRLIPRR